MTYPLVKFGDVVRQVKDKVDPQTAGLERFVAGEHMDTDNLHIRRWGDVGDGYLGPAFHMRFKPGQVLYGSRRTYLRKVAVAEFEGITANTTYVIEPQDPDVLLPDFLPFVMQTETFHAHSIQQSKGSVNPYINFSDIAWYEFPLPPVDEQRRIADLLWAADDVIERNDEAISGKSTKNSKSNCKLIALNSR
jgi:type I restriction enzyme, S subunit